MKTILIALLLILVGCGSDPKPIPLSDKVILGGQVAAGSVCHWLPTEGLDNPNSCNPELISLKKTTVYTQYVVNHCGEASQSSIQHAWKKGPNGQLIEVK